jgi:hypothetical protein
MFDETEAMGCSRDRKERLNNSAKANREQRQRGIHYPRTTKTEKSPQKASVLAIFQKIHQEALDAKDSFRDGLSYTIPSG